MRSTPPRREMVPARAVVVYVESECVALAVVVYPGEPLARQADSCAGSDRFRSACSSVEHRT